MIRPIVRDESLEETPNKGVIKYGAKNINYEHEAMDFDQRVSLRNVFDRTKGQNIHPDEACVHYYQAQSKQTLGSEKDVKVIKYSLVGINTTKWGNYIDLAVKDINDATPGLRLIRDITSPDIKIRTFEGDGTECFTRVIDEEGKTIDAEVNFDNNWVDTENGFLYTALHEILHGLGLDHEHQRHDASKSIFVKTLTDPNVDPMDTSESLYDQLTPNQFMMGMTPFDPESVMMYDEGCYETQDGQYRLERKPEDSHWEYKEGSIIHLSELDKITLNLAFRPCIRENLSNTSYHPKLGKVRMYYCGRNVLGGNKYCLPCGPDYGPNCPSCRVLNSQFITSLHGGNPPKWQGKTGLVYCNKNCGPHAGQACEDCLDILFPDKTYRRDYRYFQT